MTGKEFKRIRTTVLGWSQPRAATELGYKHPQAGSMISKWENGLHPIPPPVVILISLLAKQRNKISISS